MFQIRIRLLVSDIFLLCIETLRFILNLSRRTISQVSINVIAIYCSTRIDYIRISWNIQKINISLSGAYKTYFLCSTHTLQHQSFGAYADILCLHNTLLTGKFKHQLTLLFFTNYCLLNYYELWIIF